MVIMARSQSLARLPVVSPVEQNCKIGLESGFEVVTRQSMQGLRTLEFYKTNSDMN